MGLRLCRFPLSVLGCRGAAESFQHFDIGQSRYVFGMFFAVGFEITNLLRSVLCALRLGTAPLSQLDKSLSPKNDP